MSEGISIRPVMPSDDFETMNNLLRDTLLRFNNDLTIDKYGITAERLRSDFFPIKGSEEQILEQETVGFIAEVGGRIVAFVGFMLLDETHNGYNMMFGIDHRYMACLDELLDRCCKTVKEKGGSKCYKIVPMKAGEVRNPRIAFWEKYGFISEKYFYQLIELDLTEWTPLNDVDIDGIYPINDVDYTEVESILKEDDVDFLAPRDKTAMPTRDHIFLTLRGKSSEITGIGYYKVRQWKKAWKGKDYDGLLANALGIHFRPEAQLSRKDKRRFIQAMLLSMKQLGVNIVNGKVSSKDFDTYIELMAQGFRGDAIEVRLYRDL
jgi:hypothetical protein